MNQLRRVHRHLLYLVGAALLGTGIVWAVLHYFGTALEIDEHTVARVNVALMRIHGGAAMLALILLGTMLFEHVGAGWRFARNKPSGIAILTLSMLLIVTGYLLYYAGGEELRQKASLVHLAAGTIIPAAVIAHAFRMMRQRRRHFAARRALHYVRRRVANGDGRTVEQRSA